MKLKLILTIIVFLSLSCNEKVEYFFYQIDEKPEYFFEGNYNENNSLQNIDSMIYKIVESQGFIKNIYDKLIQNNQLRGVAVYTYQKGKINFIESIWFQFNGSNNFLYGFHFTFNETFWFENNVVYEKLMDEEKFEYLLNFQSKETRYNYLFSKKMFLGFPKPIPDSTNELEED